MIQILFFAPLASSSALLRAKDDVPLRSPVTRTPAAGHLDRPLRGILLVLASTIFLAASDVTAKYLAGSLPVIQVAWMRFAVFALIMLLAAIWCRQFNPLTSKRPGLQIVRGLGLVGSAVLFISALQVLPVAEASAITFVSPIFVTALSIPFLGETIGWRRWTAAVIGLLGVLVIVRPGTGAFHPGAILPILSSFCWAIALVATRRTSASDDARTTMTYSALVGLACLTLLVPFFWETPSWREILLGTFVGASSTAGHWMVVIAFRYAGASVLAPFSYSQILWATLLGYLVFGAIPDGWTWLGAGVIIASSLYSAHRERIRARPRPR
jgi:drug/metabolite transporter (DMT)-like permease